MNIKAGLFVGTMLTALVSQPAAAQVVGEAKNQPDASGPGDVASDIVVTGSRIGRNGNEAPTPVTVVSVDQLQQSAPRSIAEGLNQLPQFLGSFSPAQSQSTMLSEAHGNILNLRNAGAIRTLILMDGQRVPPTSSSGLVDVSVIPEALVARVDVVTAGASAVYGSDAVTGVVNFILDSKFTGVKALAQRGVSSRGDGGSYRLGVTAGTSLLDGGAHLLLSADRNDSTGIQKLDRPYGGKYFFAVPELPGAPGTASNPLVFKENVVSSNLNATGLFRFGPPGVQGQTLTPGGQITPFNPGRFAGAGQQIGGSGTGTSQNTSLITGLRTDRLFGRLSFDIAPNLSVYAQGSYSKSTAAFNSSENPLVLVPFYGGNPFFPPGMQAAINAAPGPAQGNISSSVCGAQAAACFLRLVQDIGPLRQTETTEAKSFAFGLKGEVFKDWQVDAFYSHGDVDLKASEANQFENRPLRAALDVVTDPGTGRPVCRVTLTNPGLFPGCLPYNPFITNGNSAEVVSYITGVSQFRTRNKTDNASLSLAGQPFSTWAGPVGMSVGVEYRRDSLNLTSNSNPSVPIDYTGIRGINSASAPLRFFLTNRGIANGKRNVKEVFGELNVPLLRDAALAQSLEVSGAVRYTDYSTSGTVTTWKAGVSYEPVDGLRFRATRSRDIRAPTLLDLYAGATTSLQNPADPHCNCTNPNFLRSTSGGNPDLDPELGDTLSLGVILQPRFVPGFAISVDYYDLTIKDAIQTLGVPQILQDCEDSGGTANSCALISRPLPFSDRSAANVATAVRSVPANTARFQTRGIDIEASYNIRFGGSQNLNLRALANYIDKYTTQSSVTSPVQQLAGFSDGPETPALPTWRGTLSAQYSTENFSLSVQERIVGRIKTGPQFVYATKAMPTVYYTDVTVTAKVPGSEGSSELFLTVNNLFDKQPPLFPDRINSGVFYPTLQSVYDVMGRYFTAGVRLRF